VLDDLIDRYQFAWQTVRDCLRVIRRRKSLLLFPLLSAAACLLFLTGLFQLLQSTPNRNWQVLYKFSSFINPPNITSLWATAAIIALAYCSLNLLILYFNTAFVHCCINHMRGTAISPLRGLVAAFRCIPNLLLWSLFSGTLGFLLRPAEWLLHRDEEYGRFLVPRISSVIWTMATYFVIPVLVNERLRLIPTLRRSASLVSKTWGKRVIGYVGVGFFMLPFWLLSFALIGFSLSTETSVADSQLTLPAIAVLSLLCTGLLNSTLDCILQSALYVFATERFVANGWRSGRLQHAFYSAEFAD
jgi:hypothetical protein